jgi:hypothetical protein
MSSGPPTIPKLGRVNLRETINVSTKLLVLFKENNLRYVDWREVFPSEGNGPIPEDCSWVFFKAWEETQVTILLGKQPMPSNVSIPTRTIKSPVFVFVNPTNNSMGYLKRSKDRQVLISTHCIFEEQWVICERFIGLQI